MTTRISIEPLGNIKKICFLQGSISRKSGGQSSILDLAETIHVLGYDVRIGLTSGNLIYRLKGFKNHLTSIPYKNIYTIPQFFNVSIRKSQKPYLYEITRSVLIKLGGKKKKLINYLYESDLIVIATLFADDTIRNIKKNTKASIVYNHAGSPDTYEHTWLPRNYNKCYSKSNRHRYIEFCNQFDGILFQSKDQANECISRGAIPKSKSYVLPPSCVEQNVLAASQSINPYPSRRRAIVCVGSIQKRKAQRFALEVFSQIAKEIPNIDLHFIGSASDADYEVSLKNIVQQHGLEKRVFFHGHRPDYLRFMAHAEILIQTSESEGVSRVLREAMLMKLPIVSFAISGTTSLLRGGLDALLIEPNNKRAMAEAVICLIKNKKGKCKIANSAFKRYIKNNSWPVYASNIKDMINYFTKQNPIND